MPKGNPKPSTLAAERYQKKAGWITKGFKIKKEVADRFAAACDFDGVSQASKITELINEYCKQKGIL